jgi:hypothetical protein
MRAGTTYVGRASYFLHPSGIWARHTTLPGSLLGRLPLSVFLAAPCGSGGASATAVAVCMRGSLLMLLIGRRLHYSEQA